MYGWRKYVKLVKKDTRRKTSVLIVFLNFAVVRAFATVHNLRKVIKCALGLSLPNMRGIIRLQQRRDSARGTPLTRIESLGTREGTLGAPCMLLKEYHGLIYTVSGKRGLRREMGINVFYAFVQKILTWITTQCLSLNLLKSIGFLHHKTPSGTQNFGTYQTDERSVFLATN